MAGEPAEGFCSLAMNASKLDRRKKTKSFSTVLLGSFFLLFFLANGNFHVRAEGDDGTPVPTETTQTPIETFLVTATETATPTHTPSPPTGTATAVLEIPALRGDYVEDEILVRFAPVAGGAQAASDACFVNEQVEVRRELDAVGASLLKINQGSVAEIIAQAENCPQVIFAEPNYELFALDTFPNDTYWGQQYGLSAIHAPQGWDLETGSTAVVIAIIDTGVDLVHPDLASKLVPGYDFVNDDSVPQDDNGHGSHVAGIAAASSNNDTGISGVSWGARIMPVKVLNASASGTFADAAAGIIWAADNGAHIINLSLGGSSHSQIFQDAIDYAYGKGVMLIASSGNAGSGFILYPARFPNVMAVGATDSNNVLAGFSNYGPELDVVAPGVNIYSTGLGAYYYNSGTSMAAPFVSGLASILRGMPGSGSPANLAWTIKSTALDLGVLGNDIYYGDGLIQMDTAIQLLWISPTPTPPQISEVPATKTSVWLVPVTQTASPTSTPTVTVSPTLTPLPSQTLITSPGAMPEDGGEAELHALSAPTQIISHGEKKSSTKDNLPLCVGSFFIFAGLLLFMFARKMHSSKV